MHSEKIHCTVSTSATTKYQEIRELVITDLWGPAQVMGKGGANYFISFTDAATRFSVVNFLKEKSNALGAYKQFESQLWTQYNRKIKCIRSESGREFLNKKFITHLR